MKKRRIVVLVHEELVPPEDIKGMSDEEVAPFKTEYDVVSHLHNLGHEVRVLGLHDEIRPMRELIRSFEPHIVFNLLEEFREEAAFDHYIVAYLELLDVSYTGCNAGGLFVSRDKALSKKILAYHRIRVPHFMTVPRRRRAKRTRRLAFPLIVKSLNEEASMGLSQASVVHDDEALAERVKLIHEEVGTPAIVEQYIEGRELYASVLGNKRLEVFPVWELQFEKKTDDILLINDEKAKWDTDFQNKYGVTHGPARLSDQVDAKVKKIAKRIYRRLGLDGYARIDFRLTDDGRLYFLEANPNPDIALDEELASAAYKAGYKYPDLMQKIIRLGLAR